jgi:mono/diheme cytochrome c family protein
VPGGDRARGRQLFADLECHKCHTIKGEGFPAAGEEPKQAGPELTGMGAEHPAEYIAESILAPNHVIVDGPGFIGPDGLSTMPSFADSLSLAQWLDLVAYLQSLTTGVGDAPHTDHGIERERVMGDYRIRLVYAGRRLSVFVTDREFDEPVPYLPVTAVIQAARRPTERLRLEPRMDDHGFSYGLDLTLPPRIAKITLSIGPTTMDLAGSARKKFTQPVTVPFDWEPGHR